MIFKRNINIRNIYDFLLLGLVLGIYFNITSALLCFTLMGIRALFIGRNELAIYLLLFGTAFLGIIFRIYSIPIPGAAIATLLGIILVWDQILIIIKQHSKSFIYLLLISSVFVISYFYGPQNEYSMEKLGGIFYTGFSTLIVFLVFVRKPNVHNRDIAQLLLLTGVTYIALSIDFFNYSSPQSLFDFNFFRDSSIELKREGAAQMVYHTPALASMYGLAFLLSAIKTKTLNKLYLALFIVTSFLIILISGARQGIIGFAIIILVWHYLNNKQKKLYFTVFSIAFLTVLFIILSAISTDHIEKMLTSDTIEGSLNRNYDRAFDIIKEKPLFGEGLGGYPDESYGKNRYPHNIILEILSEAGFLGLLLCFLVVYNYLKRIKILNYVTANNSKYFLLFTAFAIRTMVSEDLGANIVFFSLIFAMVYYNKKNTSILK